MAHQPASPQRHSSECDAHSNDNTEHSTFTRSTNRPPWRPCSYPRLRLRAVGLLAAALVACVECDHRHHPDSAAYSLSPTPSRFSGTPRSTTAPQSPTPTKHRHGAGAELRKAAPSVRRARSHKAEAVHTRTPIAAEPSSTISTPTISSRPTALTRSGDVISPAPTLGLTAGKNTAARAVVCFDLDQTLSMRHTHKMAQRAQKTGEPVDFLDAFGPAPHLLTSVLRRSDGERWVVARGCVSAARLKTDTGKGDRGEWQRCHACSHPRFTGTRACIHSNRVWPA
ncbi:hypothetical protein T484DRAFT_1744395 [Baffinella frigidus]|nr:hypothetical protein T484DRAFT_1744395 [Cryptophyta sp. CCMP2293]